MPYVKNNKYRDIPFCKETPHGDFYMYSNVRDLASRSLQADAVIRCQTIGILKSINGKFFLTDLDSSSLDDFEPLVRVSMLYLKSQLPSTVIPYPVQVFGTLQWKNRPVIYANILQVLKVPIALRIRDAMCTIVNSHKANKPDDSNEEHT